jgi:guanine deaminase
MCLAAIYWARLRKIYYGNTRRDAARIKFDDKMINREMAKPRSRRKIPTEQVLRKEAIRVFEAWELKGDKVVY